MDTEIFFYTSLITKPSTWYNPPTSTSTNTTYHSTYIGTKPTPFNVVFSWEDKSVNISLKNGNDIFKLANVFMKWLDNNEIEYNIKTKKQRKKK